MTISKAQVEIYELVRSLFPHARVIMNYPLGNRQTIDIFVKDFNIGIEVDGKQHDNFVEFFHKNLLGFNIQKLLDRKKEVLCKELGIVLVRIKYDKGVNKDTLLRRIKEAIKIMS
jgi:very-short-patch-repair endonuclease